jgi:altronate dehydratase
VRIIYSKNNGSISSMNTYVVIPALQCMNKHIRFLTEAISPALTRIVIYKVLKNNNVGLNEEGESSYSCGREDQGAIN